MPELPDIVVYIEALEGRVLGEPLRRLRPASPFLLRSVDPPVSAAAGKHVIKLRRIGKRIVLELEDDLFLVLHLMIAGRLHWREADAVLAGKQTLAAFDFPAGSLVLTEAGLRKRASLHVVRGEEGLREHDPGGLEVLDASLGEFRAAITETNHTLKRALTDPRIFSGIGNAYSDEILHGARLSPVKWTQRLEPEEVERLFRAVKDILVDWTARLREDAGGGFPEKSRPSEREWRCTAVIRSRARSAALRCSGSSMPRRRRTTARDARRGESCWPTAPCPGCSRGTGPARSRTWRRGGARAISECLNWRVPITRIKLLYSSRC